MSYMVLARKFRPNTWNDVVGQSHVTHTLQNAIRHNRLAHAYLFTGPRGVGKTSIARILAKALNCVAPSDGNPCGECASCREISAGNSVDVLEIDGASNRGIDEVRNLRENIKYSPSGQYRIYIIDEVHMLTTPAFNALLKTLEEPPSHALFIFATTEPHKVPATIVSRCQRFDFKRVASAEIAGQLRRIADAERISIDDAAIALIARKADGSLRDSQSILDQMISFAADTITVEEVISGLGLIESAFFFTVTDSIAGKNMKEGIAIVDRVVAGGYDIEEFLAGLLDHLRNCLIIKAAGSADMIDASAEDKQRFSETASRFDEGDLLRLIRIVAEARIDLKYAADPRLPLELAIIKMIRLDKTVTIDELLGKLEALAAGGAPGSGEKKNSRPADLILEERELPSEAAHPSTEAAGPEPVEAPPADAERDSADGLNRSVPGAPARVVTLDIVKRKWIEVVHLVKHRKITIGSFLNEGVLLGVKDGSIHIGFSMQNGFHIDAIMKSRQMVEEVLAEVFGQPLTFSCVKKDLPPKEFVTTSRKEKQAQLSQMQEHDPVIRKIIDDFDAEIVD
ncbi:DNA polymerase III subunit gamma/tau [bacterium]|nr:DNA polymerase III subunit gamma/tau [bacterium]